MYKITIAEGLRQQITEEEVQAVQAQAELDAKMKNKALASLELYIDEEGYFSSKAVYESSIVRTRRITGYMSNTANFNPAKVAELQDRKAHM